MEQDVQTLITWTHGTHPAWLQYHGPAHDAREHPRCGGTQLRILPPPPPPPLNDLLLPPDQPPPPPELPRHLRSVFFNLRSASSTRSMKHASKRARTLRSVTASSAPRYPRRPLTMFAARRSSAGTRTRSVRCKQCCRALLLNGKMCLSPCVRYQPEHFDCRCWAHRKRE